MMAAGAEGDLQEPVAVGVAFHREGLGLPVVEIPDEGDPSRGGRGASETDQRGQFLCGIWVLVVKVVIMVGVGIRG